MQETYKTVQTVQNIFKIQCLLTAFNIFFLQIRSNLLQTFSIQSQPLGDKTFNGQYFYITTGPF